MVSDERLREALDYNSDTGLFTWRTKSRAGKTAGNLNAGGYVQLMLDRQFYYAHRLAWFFAHGEWPPSKIDHKNGIRHDNRIANLRLASNLQNAWNLKKRRAGLKGVFYNPRRQKWYAQIRHAGIKHHLGLFATELEAHAAYCDAAIRMRGEFANLE